MRAPLAILFAAAALTVNAIDYYNQKFPDTSAMPSNITLVDGDGAPLKDGAYKNLGKTSESWFINRLSGSYDRVALSATRHGGAFENVAAENWLILPAVEVNSADAVVRWEARSVHEKIRETYRVAVRAKGTATWSDLYVSEGESNWWNGHVASLAAWVGSEVEVAFVATTVNGFLLAVDNIVVGVPRESDAFIQTEMLSRRFTTIDDAEVRVRITNLGPDPGWTRINLAYGSFNVDEFPLPDGLPCGASVEVTFKVDATLNRRTAYKLRGFTGKSYTTIVDDYVYATAFPRTSLFDRFTGTWCPNCPTMGHTVQRLKRIHGDDIIVAEAHIGDVLQNSAYRTGYADSFVYAIPTLTSNHEPVYAVNGVDDSDDLSAQMQAATPFGVEARSTVRNSKLTVKAEVRVAESIDNSADRYRVGYLLLGDYHSATRGGFVHDNNTTSYKRDMFYYLPDVILPELMYYDNVVIDGSLGCKGVAGSLPAALTPGTAYTHSTTFAIPSDSALDAVRCVALVFDSTTGRVVNCSLAVDSDGSGIELPEIDPVDDEADAIYYDLTGRRVENPSGGIFIRRTPAGASKVIL